MTLPVPGYAPAQRTGSVRLNSTPYTLAKHLKQSCSKTTYQPRLIKLWSKNSKRGKGRLGSEARRGAWKSGYVNIGRCSGEKGSLQMPLD